MGSAYPSVISKEVVRWRGYFLTGPTVWVNLTDPTKDIFLAGLFPYDGTIGCYELGNIGSVLSPVSRFKMSYQSSEQAWQVPGAFPHGGPSVTRLVSPSLAKAYC